MPYRFGDFEVDVAHQELRRAGRPVALPPLPFALLVYLIEHRDRVVGKRELLEQVWHRTHTSESTLPTCIRTLRKALDDPADAPRIVVTVRGRGYRFAASLAGPIRSERAKGGRSVDFIGRDAELAALSEELAAAAVGQARVAFLVGEPGIGKTRLAEEFGLRAAGGDVDVVEGRCAEGEGAPPYWPWIQVLRSFAAAPQVVSSLSGLGSGTVQPGDPGRDRFILFHSVAEELRGMTGSATLLLMLDDLHRADMASLRLLEFVLQELRGSRILVVGTYRDIELAHDEARAAALGRVARRSESRFIQLDGLNSQEARQLAETRAGRNVSAEVALRLHEQSGGNPFFLTHLVTALIATDDVEALHLPRGLREAISEQLESLPVEHRSVLQNAAVFGREFEPAILERICPPDSPVAEAVHQATQARILAPGGDPEVRRFSHMLVRDVLFEGIPVEDRPSLHESAGVALETLRRSSRERNLSALAHHFAEAIPKAGPDKALRYATAAGAQALDRCAYEEAVEHYSRAVSIADAHEENETRLCELLVSLGDAQGRACKRELGTETLLRAAHMARRIGAAVHLADAALRFSPGFFAVEAGIEDKALVGLLREAIEILGDRDPRLRAQLLGRLAMARYWVAPADELDALLSEAKALSLAHGDAATRVAVQQAMLVAGWSVDNTAERLTASHSLIQDAEEVNDPGASLVARLLRMTTLMELGEIEQVDRSIREFEQIAHRDRETYGIWYSLLLQAMRHQVTGDLVAAGDLATRFRALGERIQGVNTELSSAAFQVLPAWERGQLSKVIGVAAELAERPNSLGVIRATRARIALDLGATETAQKQLDGLIEDGVLTMKRDPSYLWTLSFLAEIVFDLGDSRNATPLYRALLPFADRYAIGGYSVMCWGSVSRHLGQLAAVLGRTDEATAHFERALEMNRAIGARPFVALTARDYAQLLSGLGDAERERGRVLLLEARREASEMGLVRLLAACEELASELGVGAE